MKKEGILELCTTNEDALSALSLISEVLKEFASYENAFGSDLENLLTYYRPKIHRYLWIYKVDNEIIGTIGLDEKTNFRAEIRRFFIAPSYREKGYGKQLFQSCLNQAKNNNYKELFLDVSVIQKRALKFYQSRGFTHTGYTNYGSYILELSLENEKNG
ncbi:MAG: GNAT family N-acetyltransferase [Saprospiraceae bacterium]